MHYDTVHVILLLQALYPLQPVSGNQARLLGALRELKSMCTASTMPSSSTSMLLQLCNKIDNSVSSKFNHLCIVLLQDLVPYKGSCTCCQL